VTESEKTVIRPIRLGTYVLLLAAGWTASIVAVLVWNLLEHEREVLEAARIQAQSAYEKDLIYRHWNAEHGGVYVPVTEATPPNPYLLHVEERDITTPSGRRLTLVDPACMARQIHELEREGHAVRGHLTSLNPIRAENAPDPWEAAALRRLAGGESEVSAVKMLAGEPQLRLMRPMFTEERCLSCHAAQGYRVGDLRGGFSVAVPMAPLRANAMGHVATLALANGLLWILGLGGIVLGARRVSARIREREKAEEALRRSKRFLQTVIDAIPDALMVVDRDYRIVLANRAVRRMTGGKDPVFSRLKCHSVAQQRDAPCKDGGRPCPLERVVSTKAPIVVTLTHRGADGSGIPVEVVVAPVLDDAGEVVQIIESCRDITERKRAEEERRQLEARLQQAQKLESLGVLAGGIAHDFNNLLVGVLGNASLALEELPGESRVRELLQRIDRSARRAADLTRQLLAYSGKGRFVIRPLNLSTLVVEMAQLLQTSVSKRVALKHELPDDLPLIEADETQVRQVVMNLITNAAEAIGVQDGLITVRTGVVEADQAYLSDTYLDDDLPQGPYVFVDVADTGCGMDEATRSKIFDPFFTTKFTGRGLGLAAVLGIVRSHQGAIKVESEPGRGTSFKVLFPVSESCPEPVAEEEPALGKLDGAGTVLVVDDEEAVRSFARAVLERRGCTVITAGDGREALDVFRARADEIDAIVLDLTMPHLSGEDVFRELYRIRAAVPVILSSGYDEEDVTARFAGMGLAGFVQKPYRVNVLTEKVARVLVTRGAPRPCWNADRSRQH
jgi:signal transduction histidine kinase/CheY-like chemotaxis protein